MALTFAISPFFRSNLSIFITIDSKNSIKPFSSSSSSFFYFTHILKQFPIHKFLNFLYIYIYIYMIICMYMYTYIYIYVVELKIEMVGPL